MKDSNLDLQKSSIQVKLFLYIKLLNRYHLLTSILSLLILFFLYYKMLFNEDNHLFLEKKVKNNLNIGEKETLQNKDSFRLLLSNITFNETFNGNSDSSTSKNFNSDLITNDVSSENYQNSCNTIRKFSSEKLVKVGILNSLTGTMSI